jgi:hypothetical protein
MYIGGSIFLLAVGAILSFAVTDSVNGVDLVTVGYILMAAGALGIVLSLFIAGNARGRDQQLPPR